MTGYLQIIIEIIIKRSQIISRSKIINNLKKLYLSLNVLILTAIQFALNFYCINILIVC